MANYYAAARSNYFRVKDVQAFEAWVDSTEGLACWSKEEDGVRYFALSGHDGGWPSFRCDGETGDCTDIDLPAELAAHLADDSIAVLMESGAEALRYVVGHAIAVHPNGETVEITLNDIYRDAQEAFGDTAEITEAGY